MIIKRVKLENYRSHSNTTVDFSKGVNLILGKNGKGKTSILEAISSVMFNTKDRSGKETGKNFIKFGEKSGKIEVEFTANDGRDYIFKTEFFKSKPKKQSLTDINGLDCEGDIQENLEELCGIKKGFEETYENIVIAKQNVLLFKPSIDNRYEENKVSTHNGNSFESVNIDKAEQIYDYVIDKEYDIIGIDEVQFFDDKIIGVINKLADDGIRVIVAGLDMDFKAEPFHPMPEIMAISEMVTKLHAVCNKCGKEASRSQRLINGEPAKYDDPIVVIGASESYEARCRHCHEIKR